MTKPYLGKLGFGHAQDARIDSAAPAGSHSPASDLGHKSSVDPLAQTDHYRLVVPFARDPRRLSGRLVQGRANSGADGAGH